MRGSAIMMEVSGTASRRSEAPPVGAVTATVVTGVPGAVQMQLEAPLVKAVTAAGVLEASGTA